MTLDARPISFLSSRLATCSMWLLFLKVLISRLKRMEFLNLIMPKPDMERPTRPTMAKHVVLSTNQYIAEKAQAKRKQIKKYPNGSQIRMCCSGCRQYHAHQPPVTLLSDAGRDVDTAYSCSESQSDVEGFTLLYFTLRYFMTYVFTLP